MPRLRSMMAAFVGDPLIRTKRGWLSHAEMTLVAEQIKSTPRPYDEIADDFLISASRVSAIAKQFGVQRRPTSRDVR